MKYIFTAAVLLSQTFFAQAQTAEQKKMEAGIRASVNYLADDKLEGRRTGSAGEKLAYEYIRSAFKKAGLTSLTPDYLQAFEVNEGREIDPAAMLVSADKTFTLHKDFFPLPFSGAAKALVFRPGAANVAVYGIADALQQNEANPHFDFKAGIAAAAELAKKQGKLLLIVKNDAGAKGDFVFDAKDKTPNAGIPVVYMKMDAAPVAAGTAAAGGSAAQYVLTASVVEKKKTGHNVIGYINNKAANTIILGAHYDHLGYGEDHNSLFTGSTPTIHNGADDNASGTAALIALGGWLQNAAYKKYNYLLVSFSGEELGLYGSKYFTEHAGIDLKSVNYMINMDMIGRLSDSTHGLTIGGYGTSPSWGNIINTKDNYLKINTDSSGSGPSDHTSFYRKDIPVLFFFTGSHKDYHKPSDDADKINFAGEMQVIRYIQNIIAQTDKMDKLVFSKTREVSMGKSSFKVSLGIMPDYTFSGSGVLVDGVSENKAAQRAGIKTGDVLVQLGEHRFSDVQTYMDALNKFNKGESTNVKLQRGKEELILPVTF